MTIKFECPHCGQRISAESDDSGANAVCPTCNTGFSAPDSHSDTPPPSQPVITSAVSAEPGKKLPDKESSETRDLFKSLAAAASNVLLGKAKRTLTWTVGVPGQLFFYMEKYLVLVLLKIRIHCLKCFSLRRAYLKLGRKALEKHFFAEKYGTQYAEILAFERGLTEKHSPVVQSAASAWKGLRQALKTLLRRSAERRYRRDQEIRLRKLGSSVLHDGDAELALSDEWKLLHVVQAKIDHAVASYHCSGRCVQSHVVFPWWPQSLFGGLLMLLVAGFVIYMPTGRFPLSLIAIVTFSAARYLWFSLTVAGNTRLTLKWWVIPSAISALVLSLSLTIGSNHQNPRPSTMVNFTQGNKNQQATEPTPGLIVEGISGSALI